MSPSNSKWWAKVLFSEFIKHYRKMTPEQKAKDIDESMDALEELDDQGNSFGSKMVRWSLGRKELYPQASENGKKGGRPRKNPQDAPNGNAGVDRKSRTSCDQFTADGDTREDSLNMTPVRKNGALESGTSANLYGDAATSDGADVSTTVPKNMRRVPQNEAPAHGFSGGRTAQGTMSRSPEAAAQSGKDYDQETASGNYQVTDKVSTDEKPTGGHLLPSSSRPPVGDRHAAVDVLNLAYSGEFGNVKLTQEQYGELGIKFGNMQKLNRAIDSLSCKLENEEIKPVPKNHYAVLLKWASYREDMEEQKELEESKPKMTEMEKSWIAAMKRVEAM